MKFNKTFLLFLMIQFLVGCSSENLGDFFDKKEVYLRENHWYAPRADNQNTASAKYSGPKTNRLAWIYSFSELRRNSPLLVEGPGKSISYRGVKLHEDGTAFCEFSKYRAFIGLAANIFCGTSLHSFGAFNQDCILLWEISTNRNNSSLDYTPIFSLQRNDGQVIVGCFGYNVGEYWGRILSLDSDDGHISHDVLSEAVVGIAISNEQNLYTIERDGYSQLIKRNQDYSTEWQITLSSSPSDYSLIINDSENIYIRNAYGLQVFDRFGKEIWNRRDIKIHEWYGTWSCMALSSSDTLYVTGVAVSTRPRQDEPIFLYSINSIGALNWKTKLPGVVLHYPPFTNILPIVDKDETVYVNTQTCITALDSAGQILWEYCDNEEEFEVLAITATNTLYCSGLHTLYAFHD